MSARTTDADRDAGPRGQLLVGRLGRIRHDRLGPAEQLDHVVDLARAAGAVGACANAGGVRRQALGGGDRLDGAATRRARRRATGAAARSSDRTTRRRRRSRLAPPRRSAARGWCRSRSRPAAIGDHGPMKIAPALRTPAASASAPSHWRLTCSAAIALITSRPSSRSSTRTAAPCRPIVARARSPVARIGGQPRERRVDGVEQRGDRR